MSSFRNTENCKTSILDYDCLNQNPALNLQPEEKIEIVRFIVKDWKQKSEIVL